MKKVVFKIALISSTLLAIIGCSTTPKIKINNTYEGDVIVYGGTSGAVVAAICSILAGATVLVKNLLKK